MTNRDYSEVIKNITWISDTMIDNIVNKLGHICPVCGWELRPKSRQEGERYYLDMVCDHCGFNGGESDDEESNSIHQGIY